ncbi:MAG TPA: penicillin-binding transpeptidase domain-containing protein, partial [Acidimicrobiales bacterium]|nr:penicillin-binding transpeptidase domain-containing protein [Acidimicrobiales bacterium]
GARSERSRRRGRLSDDRAGRRTAPRSTGCAVMQRQIRRLGVALLAAFGLLFLQLNYVQVVNADKYANAPGNTRKATVDFSRERGVIQTADGVLLARSAPTNDALKRLRQYPEGDLFAQITGFFSFTYGSDGVERVYGSELAGRRLAIRRLSDVLTNRTRTGDVTLTLTKRLQLVAKNALGPRKGAVVAINPTDGSILAMWSSPSYDPNPLSGHDQRAVVAAWKRLQADPNKPMLPRAYRERYSPGSTFKVVTAAAALDQAPELVTRRYPIHTELPLPETNRPLPNFGGEACGGTLPDLLRVSCNTGFGQMGLDLGGEKLSGEAKGFGFDQTPPLDLPAVARSVFPDATAFVHDKPALAKSAIGQQDVAATPLEMALVASAIANGGVAMRPHVLAEIRDSEGAVVQSWQPRPWVQAASPGTASKLRDMMVGVVTGGTATRAAVPGVVVAAKTGTAQTIGDNAHAWLIAFAPADAPKVAVAVIVESQPGLGDNVTGGRVAAPIASAMMAAALGK